MILWSMGFAARVSVNSTDLSRKLKTEHQTVVVRTFLLPFLKFFKKIFAIVVVVNEIHFTSSCSLSVAISWYNKIAHDHTNTKWLNWFISQTMFMCLSRYSQRHEHSNPLNSHTLLFLSFFFSFDQLFTNISDRHLDKW